jgi:hypothetical protein
MKSFVQTSSLHVFHYNTQLIVSSIADSQELENCQQNASIRKRYL